MDSVPGQSGSGKALTWSGTVNTTTSFRIEAQLAGYQVPLNTAGGNTSVQVTVPSTLPTIVLSQREPVQGSVNVSIGGGGTYSSVSYYLDLNAIGSSTTAPAYSDSFSTAGITSGSHLLIARLVTAPDSYLEIRLTIQVATPEVALQLNVVGTSGTVDVNVTATSAYGITSVTATLDGNSLGTLTAPNQCVYITLACISTYQFPVNAATAGSGTHTITATATDANGATASQTATVTFNNPPVLAISSPFDGQLVNGTLAVAGTFSSDKPGATVSVNVTLGNLSILSAATSPFSTSFSLTGVVPGTYTLTATATDNEGLVTVVTALVTVTSSPALVYTPVFTLGASSQILAVSGMNVLYSPPDGSIHLHTASGDTVLSQGSLTDLGYWRVTSGGYVLAGGFGKDRPGGSTSVYVWAPGSVNAANLSVSAGSTSIYDQLLSVHFPWVLWESEFSSASGNPGQYTLYNLSTGQNLNVSAPPNAVGVGNISCDFTTINGQLNLFYWATMQSSTLTNLNNVYRWNQASNTSTPLSQDGQSIAPQTDGVTVAWESSPTPLSPPLTLYEYGLTSSTLSTLSTGMTQFELASGLLGWVEQTTSSGNYSTVLTQTIKASSATTISSISTLLSSVFFGSSGGYIVFQENGKLYAWSPAKGRQLLFDASAGQVRLTGKIVYFVNGNQQVVYAVSLD